MGSKIVTIIMATCFLIASKYDEIDDQLVFINDVQKYFSRTGSPNNPTWTEIVETERMLMKFYNWDLGFVLPIHYVEMFIANGVLFESEDIQSSDKTKRMAARISEKCYDTLNEMIKSETCFKNQGYSGNQVASAIVYFSRKEVLGLSKTRLIWPKELQLISRQSDKDVKKLTKIYKNMIKSKHEPFSDEATTHDAPAAPQKLALVVDLILDTSETHSSGIIAKKAVGNTNSGLKNYNYRSHKDMPTTSSGLKKQFESGKNIGFRHKAKNSLHSKVTSVKGGASCHADKYNGSKDHTTTAQKTAQVRHFISAQKSEDGKVKLFAERRVSEASKMIEDNTTSLRVNNPE